MEVSRISPAPRCLRLARPLHHATTGWLAAALHEDLRIANGIGSLGIAARVDGDDNGLRAKAAADGVDQSGIGERGGVDADLVRTGFEDLRGVVCGADAAAYAEGNEELARGAAHRVEQRGAAFVGRGDVEQYDFVGAFAGMTRGLRGRVARVDDIDKLHALDDAAGVDVETGDDALGDHAVPFPGHERKLERILRPVVARFLRMKLHAHHVVAFDC